MKIEWREGSRVANSKKLDPKLIYRELEEIRRRKGKLTPEDVVSAARSPSSPMHDVFNWDDKNAAKQYRLWQARNLIRAITIIKPNGDQNIAFVHLQIEKENYYQSASVAVRNITELEAALSELRKRIASARAAYDDFVRLIPKSTPLIAAIGEGLARASEAADSAD